jgi:hypothetical protein
MNKLLLVATFSLISLTFNDFLDAQRGRGGNRQNNPRIEPEDLEFDMGVAAIKDRDMFEQLSYQGPEVSRDTYLANLEYVKFIIDKNDPDNHRVYFMNTENYRAHPPYMQMVGINSRERGAITYLPRLTSPNGSVGLYIIDFQPNDSYKFEDIQRIIKQLIETAPLLEGKIAFHPMRGNIKQYEADKKKYADAGIAVHLDSDTHKNISYLPLNLSVSFGLLTIMKDDARPSPREIVVCKTLPNEMPRVAGVVSEVRQTPLSHVNLRAIQDKVPNAFIRGAMENEEIKSLMGKLVRYEVAPQGYKIRAATKAEVDEHFSDLRPPAQQTPVRDLAMKSIKPLSEIAFENSTSFGVKTSNLATMHSFEFPEGTIPDGFGVPFSFYDEFMKHNKFYELVDQMLAEDKFQNDREVQKQQLAEFRKKIEAGDMPERLLNELSKTQKSFPDGQPIRCRSSTNNEDLPGFSGAGLYDSFTHNPDEGDLANSVKQVYASLWNFRAFEEREFYRIDHKATAMGVLLHPNFKGEKANGVAVTDDVLYATYGNYYLNTQIGEDMVTNPDSESSPEEILLGWWERDGHDLVRRSDAVGEDEQLMNDQHLGDLRARLARIHARFQKLYNKSDKDKFAMEIEYKIDKDGNLVIKQARPWVFN